MRVKYEFFSDKNIVLPYFYNEFLQSLIYEYILPERREFLHEEGYKYENRKFKLFTFSRILRHPKHLQNLRIFDFGKKISFVLSSPLNWILEETAENLIKSTYIRLGKNKLSLSSINVIPKKEFTENISLRTISPITVYSTFRENKISPFKYYSPMESEFFVQILNNLKKKFFVYYGREYNGPLRIQILKFDPKHGRQVVWFKRRPITGWNLVLKLEGERDILYLAYYAGIGAKNSAGFGCLEEVKNVRSD